MRGAIAISAAVHLAVIAVAWAGVPALFKRDLPEEAPIIVELVTIAEETRAAPEVVKPRPEPPKKEEPPPPPRPEPAAAAEPPPPPPPPPAPKPPAPKPEQVAALPPPPKPEPKPAEAPPPPPETRAAPEPPPKPEPRPKQVDVRPKTKPEPPSKAPKFDAGKIALLIDKSRKDTPEEEAKEEPKSFLQPPPRDQAPVRRAELGNRLTISEIDAIRYQIEQCWSVPAGARDAHDLVIRIHISLRPDGSLKGPPEILDREKMGDSFFRAAAESATRAVQRCTPLKNLPTTKYERWQEITLTFNPRELLGG